MTVINIHLGDSLDAMNSMKENQYDLAIVDPEYLDKNQPTKSMRKKGSMKKWNGRPSIDYFNELFRISRDQIIWGGNYFTSFLKENNNWIVWYKNNDGVCFSMAELAWSSIKKPIKVFELRPMGLTFKNHPTSKPVALYKWILKNYAKEGDKIIDTHFGSLSIGIACIEMGFDLDCWEIDEEYFDAAVKRIQNHVKQLNAFIPQPEINIFK